MTKLPTEQELAAIKNPLELLERLGQTLTIPIDDLAKRGVEGASADMVARAFLDHVEAFARSILDSCARARATLTKRPEA